MATINAKRLVGLSLTILLLTACASQRPVERISLSEVAPSEAVAADASLETTPIRMAAASIISPQETVRTYGAFFAYLGDRVGRPVEVVQRKTYEETYDLLRYGTLEIAMVCTYIFALGHEELGLQVLGAPEVNGKAEYQSFVITRADSGIVRFEDLAGRRFAYTDPLSTSGRVYPLARIRGLGRDPGAFFSSTTFTYSHDNSIQAVVQGLVDGAAVDSLVFDQWVQLNPDLGAELRVIDRSESMPSPPIAVTQSLDPELREEFRRALLDMHKDPEGVKILEALGVDRYVPQDESEYAIVHKMAREAGLVP